MNVFKRLLLILLALVACVGCDQSTKRLADATLRRAEPLSLAAGTLRLQVAHNDGAFLSLGADWPAASRATVLRVGVTLLLAALLGYALWIPHAGLVSILALALLIAGGTSNLIDRYAHGYVIDFINIGIGPLRTGIFNVADMAITLGVVLLLIAGLRRRGA